MDKGQWLESRHKLIIKEIKNRGLGTALNPLTRKFNSSLYKERGLFLEWEPLVADVNLNNRYIDNWK